jgi:glycosyltransferase involved in cell wall biosynthesis
MKILYVCGTYCPAQGGAEISMHTLLKQLKKEHQVLVITQFRYTQGKKKANFEGISLIGTDYNNRINTIRQVITEHNPDLILTQLMWSDQALRIGKQMNVPSILRICKIPYELDISKNSEYSPTKIIVVSKAVRDYVFTKSNRDAIILNSPIELDDRVISKKINGAYITMFNPLIRKGGEIFKKIAQAFPNERFAVIKGWASLREPNSDEFSDELLKQICESQGTVFSGKKPIFVNMQGINNIYELEPDELVANIYEKTKILLIPSQWEEAFGRVAIEAMANGIPVIGSDVGGLTEAIGTGGILIKDYSNPDAWICALQKILIDHAHYQKLSSSGKMWVKNTYSLERIVNQVKILLESMAQYGK